MPNNPEFSGCSHKTWARVCQLPPDFDGNVRLFPLPNFVLFPQVVQPLHIFEQRYRQMVEDALASDGLIAMGWLLPGWEASYQGRPALSRTVCLGRIVSHVRLPDGRFNLLLAGMRRATLLYEVPEARAYRIARVVALEDYYPLRGTACRAGRHRQLLENFLRRVPQTPEARKPFQCLKRPQLRLGELTDVIAFSLDLPCDVKQSLLAECNVDLRSRRLLKYLAVREGDACSGAESEADLAEHELTEHEVSAPAGAGFPPKFSGN